MTQKPLLEPFRIGFERYLHNWHSNEMVAMDKPMESFVNGEFCEVFNYAPGRMVDDVTNMLATLRKDDRGDKSEKPTKPINLPAMIYGIATDYVPTGRDFSFQINEWLYFRFAHDEKRRTFRMKEFIADARAQLVIIAEKPDTAKTMAALFAAYVDSAMRRRFQIEYEYYGQKIYRRAQVEDPGVIASRVDVGEKDITVLSLDLNIKIPFVLVDSPKESDENDGKGQVGTANPPGFMHHAIHVEM